MPREVGFNCHSVITNFGVRMEKSWNNWTHKGTWLRDAIRIFSVMSVSYYSSISLSLDTLLLSICMGPNLQFSLIANSSFFCCFSRKSKMRKLAQVGKIVIHWNLKCLLSCVMWLSFYLHNQMVEGELHATHLFFLFIEKMKYNWF